MTDPNRESPSSKNAPSSQSSDDVLEQNVESLLAKAGEPPRISDAARSRIRAQLLAGLPPRASSAFGLRRFALPGLAAALAVAAALFFWLRGAPSDDPTKPSSPSVATATRQLDDGTRVELGDGATLEVTGPRQVRITGKVLFDVVPGKGRFTVATASGTATALGTRFVVEADGESTLAAVLRGSVALRGASGDDVVLGAGQGGRVARGQPAQRHAVPRLSHLTSWVKTLRERHEANDPSIPSAPRGTLFARDPNRPGSPESPLPMKQLTVDVVVEHRVARVAIDHTFHNPADAVLEGNYRFSLPPDAALQRFSMYVDGKLNEAAVVERMRARRIYEDLVYVRQVDPALLEYAGLGKLQMRVYPLPPRQDKRIALAYTQTLPRLYDTWTVAVPLPKIDGPVEDVRFALHLANCANCEAVSPTHQLTSARQGETLELSYAAKGAPVGDSLLVTVRERRGQPDAAVAKDGADSYFHMRIPVEVPRPAGDATAVAAPRRRRWAILNDVSASRGPLERRAQAELIGALIGELDEEDQVSVLAFDVAVRELLAPTRVLDVDLKRLAEKVATDDAGIGATDAAAGLAAALARLADTGVASGASDAPPAILYLGDGVVTAGPRQLDALRQQIAGKAMFVGVGVGDGADTMTLGALAGATGGLMATIDLSDDLRWRAFDLIATLNTPRITALSAELRDSAGAILPGAMLRAPQLADGEEAELVAKLPAGSPTPARVVLRGTANGAPWEQDVAVPAPTQGLYAPRLWAQREIERMMLAKHEAPAMPACAKEPCPSPAEVREQRDEVLRKRIVELGKHHFLLSRHTSLIVLENDAMYAEYGVVQGSGQMWAPYALPKTIPVQKGPAPAPVAEEPATAELWRHAALGLAETTPASAVATSQFPTESSRKLIRDGSGAGYGTIGAGKTATKSAAPRDADLVAGEVNKAQVADKNDRAGDGAIDFEPPREEKASASPAPMQPPATVAPSESRAALADERSSGFAAGRARRGYYPGPGLVGYLMPAEMQAMRYVSSATLDDLTELVPAMSRDELSFALDAVRRARGSDEPRPAAPLQAAPPAAPVADAAAIARLDRARAALPAGLYQWGDVTVALDASRVVRWKRTLSNGLEEQAGFDGTTLVRRYDELGLDFTNQLPGSDALAVSLAYFPLLLPPADALARDFALAMDGADDVTLTALTADFGQRQPALRLTFDGDRLRRISDGRGKVLFELTWKSGALVAAAVASRPHPASFSADPGALAAMKDDADVAARAGGRVVIELPLRPIAVRTAELEKLSPGDPGAPGSMAWRFAAHQRLASAAAARSWRDQLALVETLLARGPLFAGEKTLTAAALRSLAADQRAAAVAGSDDVALYLQRRLLASSSDASGKRGPARPRRVAPPTSASPAFATPPPALPGRGALDSLAVTREVFALVDAGKGDAALLRASALPASARLWRTLAATAIARSGNADVAGLAALWSSLDGELKNLGRYQAALTYLQRGSWRRAELDNATAILSALLEDIDLQALPPPVDPSLSYWFTQSSRGVAGWRATYARWRDRVLADGDLRHTLALLRALPYDAPDDLLRILDRAATLAGSDTDQVLSVAVLAASRGQLPWALSYLTPLLDRPGAPSELARVASELAQQQGQPAEALRTLQLALDRDGGGTTADYARLLVLSQQLLLHIPLSQRPALIERATRWAATWRNAEPGGAADPLLAQLLFAASDAPGAFRVLSSSIDRDPMSGEAWGGIAEQFERAGKVEASLPYWHEAVILDQTNPTWRVRHARALLAVGQKDAAKQILTEVSRRRWHPRFEWSAYEAKDLLRTLR